MAMQPDDRDPRAGVEGADGAGSVVAPGGPPAGQGGDRTIDPVRGRYAETTLHAQTRYRGSFLRVQRDTVRLPDGTTSTREFIRHPGAVAVVPILDDGRIVLVRQFRYPLGKELLELPAGKIDPGEAIVACAMRELQEETGYTAREWAWAGGFHNAAAYADEIIEIWFARGLVAGPQRLDAGEFVDAVVVDPGQYDALALDGGIPDMKTMIGLLWLSRWREGRWPLQWLGPQQALADVGRGGRTGVQPSVPAWPPGESGYASKDETP